MLMAWRFRLWTLVLCLIIPSVQCQNITEQWRIYDNDRRQPYFAQIFFEQDNGQANYQSLMIHINSLDYPSEALFADSGWSLTNPFEALFSSSILGQLISQVQQQEVSGGTFLYDSSPYITWPSTNCQRVIQDTQWIRVHSKQGAYSLNMIFGVSGSGAILLVFNAERSRLLRILFIHLKLDFIHPELDVKLHRRDPDKDDGSSGGGVLIH